MTCASRPHGTAKFLQRVSPAPELLRPSMGPGVSTMVGPGPPIVNRQDQDGSRRRNGNFDATGVQSFRAEITGNNRGLPRALGAMAHISNRGDMSFIRASAAGSPSGWSALAWFGANSSPAAIKRLTRWS